jgi:peptidoglycan hydrolase CwlO-like protein
MQIDFLEKKFEQERKALKFQVLELEKKLEGVTKELAVVESTLTVRNSDLASLQNNLRELEELREMKEV